MTYIIHYIYRAMIAFGAASCVHACSFNLFRANEGCYTFDLGSLPQPDENGPFFQLTDGTPYWDPYLVASPCASQSAAATCAACSSMSGGTASFGFQLDNSTCAGERCLPLSADSGSASTVAFSDETNPSAGLSVAYSGGEGGRSLVYDLACAPDGDLSDGPFHTVVEDPPLAYHVSWAHPAACPVLNASVTDESMCSEPAPPPVVPTAAQVSWMEHELGAIGHFNMGTYEACGIGRRRRRRQRRLSDSNSPIASTSNSSSSSTSTSSGSSIASEEEGSAAVVDKNELNTDDELPPPETFSPEEIDVEGWLDALSSFGCQRAVLVVSHGCGFNTFPSRTSFPEFNFEYNYSIASVTHYLNGTADIAKDFVEGCRSRGIVPGFYHGAMNNYFLNVASGLVQPAETLVPGMANVTQDQYTQILLANLRQLWTDYGELGEVWFDGGFPPGTSDDIVALLKETQPSAVAFQGPGEGNVVRWCGTEDGHIEQAWATAASSSDAGTGDPLGAVWAPAEVDTCFQTYAVGDDDDGNGDGNHESVRQSGGNHSSGGDGGNLQAQPSGSPLTSSPPKNANKINRDPYAGCWFYNPDMVPKSLEELKGIYHDSVGKNGFLLLDWTPDQTGRLPSDHVSRYSEFGSFLSGCYGKNPLAQLPLLALPTSVPTRVRLGELLVLEGDCGGADRVVLQEEVSEHGHAIRAFETLASTDGGETWVAVFAGEPIGHKRIGLFFGSSNAASSIPLAEGSLLALNITALAPGLSEAVIRTFSAYSGVGC